MCIFNLPIAVVSSTKLFAGILSDGRQLTIYSNFVSAEFEKSNRGGGRKNEKKLKKKLKEIQEEEEGQERNAMILPYPTNLGTDVTLINLDKYKTLFKDANDCFPFKKLSPLYVKKSKKRGKVAKGKLRVQTVGSYNVSIATNLADIDLIDENTFVVQPNIKDLLAKHYSENYGFIICCFNTTDPSEKHPLGYVHYPASEDTVFIPTRHEHGKDHSEEQNDDNNNNNDDEDIIEDWDHEIFSLNTQSSELSGDSIEEVKEALLNEIENDDRYIVQDGQDVTSNFLPNLNKILKKQAKTRFKTSDYQSLRKKVIVGNFRNTDVILKTM